LELNKRHITVFIPALIWAGIIAFMSLLSREKIPAEVSLISDKAIHAIIYLILTSLLTLAFIFVSKTYKKKNSFLVSYITSALIAFVFGVMIEILQEKMQIGRSGDWKDALANLFGIVIAYHSVKILQGVEVVREFLLKNN
jgi:VanZ family protein